MDEYAVNVTDWDPFNVNSTDGLLGVRFWVLIKLQMISATAGTSQCSAKRTFFRQTKMIVPQVGHLEESE